MFAKGVENLQAPGLHHYTRITRAYIFCKTLTWKLEEMFIGHFSCWSFSFIFREFKGRGHEKFPWGPVVKIIPRPKLALDGPGSTHKGQAAKSPFN